MPLKPVDCYEIYNNPVMYDIESNQTVDIPFYLDLAKSYGDPILELACGTGRVSIPLALNGYQVTGIDISTPMIAHAKNKARDAGVEIDFKVADCRDFELHRKFGLIIMPYNAIAHIHDRSSHEALFASVCKHLKPEGRFSFDWFNPNEKILFRDPNRRYPAMKKFEMPDGTPVEITENNVYDKAAQINHVKWYYKIGNNKEIVKELNMRILYPEELNALLHYNGLELEAKYGDYEKTPFTSESVHQVCVCRNYHDI